MYEIWYYDMDCHMAKKMRCDTMEELHIWFERHGGHCGKILITNICDTSKNEED